MIEDGGADDCYSLLPFPEVGIYCKKRYGVYLEWSQYTEERARRILDYIKSVLSQNESVELWNVWLMGYWEYDDRPAIHKNTISIEDLKTEDILEIHNAVNWNNRDQNRPSFYCIEISR